MCIVVALVTGGYSCFWVLAVSAYIDDDDKGFSLVVLISQFITITDFNPHINHYNKSISQVVSIPLWV